jgi:RNA polymerase sigma-70 factor (ECF subfamily)
MTETEVIERCRNGELPAYKELYERYHQPMLRVALRMLNHQQDAEDAVQISFVRLYRGLKAFRFQSTFSTYLFRILCRVCFDLLRQRKQRPECITELNGVTEQNDAAMKLSLAEAIKSLPDRMRLCFILYAIEGFKQDDIARMMDITTGGVKSTLFQARVRLRRQLDESLSKKNV